MEHPRLKLFLNFTMMAPFFLAFIPHPATGAGASIDAMSWGAVGQWSCVLSLLLFFGHPPSPQKTSVALCLYPWSIPSCKKSTHPRLEADAFIHAPDCAALHPPVQLATLSSFRWLQGGLPRHLQRLHHPRKARRCSHAIPLALLASFSVVSHHSSASSSFALNTWRGALR